MHTWSYEIFLGGGTINAEKWRAGLKALADYLGVFGAWKIIVQLERTTLHYYLETAYQIPPSLGVGEFLFKPAKIPITVDAIKPKNPYFNSASHNLLDLMRKLAKHDRKFISLELRFRAYKAFLSGSAYLTFQEKSQTYLQRLVQFCPENLLAVDFKQNPEYTFKKFPKYLKAEKLLKILQPTAESALFAADTFPFAKDKLYLHHDTYDFHKHSLVLGGSGSGKSKFLAALIDQIHQTAPEQYQIVVIDPHDALKNDCQQITDRRVVDFSDLEHSINLFQAQGGDLNVSIELMLTLFRTLMAQDYNPQLERVLRYASYVLMGAGQFSFLALRKLLTDAEYRHQILHQHRDDLLTSAQQFFLTDFNALRTQSYEVAIAPIIALIDEMQMVPVFNYELQLDGLAENLQQRFLNIFSLNRTKLGDKVTQTIAGLLMQQLFLYAQNHPANDKHLLIIVDEVAIVQNPILARFLAELRKYHASVILAGQYFNQFTPELREAIFANTANYYIFRVSKNDAEVLAKNLEIKLAGSDKVEDQQNLLTGLKDRECFVQVSCDGEMQPGCKAKTLDFVPTVTAEPCATEDLLRRPFNFHTQTSGSVLQSEETTQFSFDCTSTITPRDLMNQHSSDRKRRQADKTLHHN